MEDKFTQQLKKGVLEMLVLELVCASPTYGYELLSKLKDSSGGLFVLKEGTLYPILYRLEDDGLIGSRWHQGAGRAAPKKMCEATDKGKAESLRRRKVWRDFVSTVDGFYQEGEAL